MKANSKAFYLVLGMHRSGTSCLTGALERCGVYLGEVRRTGKHNKKGYFENKTVQELHDQMLGMNLGSWHEPPTTNLVHQHHFKVLERIVKELKNHAPSGLKDPRTLLFLETWEELIGNEGRLIGTFRHPLAVAQSMNSRSGMPIEKGLKLWIHYNEILVERHQKAPFSLIEFDLSDARQYRQKIIEWAKIHELKPYRFRLKRFITPKLEHQNFKKVPIPENCKELYRYLQDHSL